MNLTREKLLELIRRWNYASEVDHRIKELNQYGSAASGSQQVIDAALDDVLEILNERPVQ
jgi:hypothetical protein